ncbi:abortive infection family protein [Oceanivirga salmonicida]|uniref:abortive infection family protein n=1 Tax=Oceanivirga salmonicida TaxID=1769291 RepID=UPI0012E18499|nr:abortive infection family protein [Oceanivirga salmonicida]
MNNNKNSKISYVQKKSICDFFNESGYVLDFSNTTFEDFTINSVSISIQEKYMESKGRSLTKFILEEKDILVIKLLKDLIEYCDCNYDRLIKKENKVEKYKIIKDIINKITTTENIYEDLSNKIIESFSTDYIANQINLMNELKHKSTYDSIGRAKELLETCCKTILEKCDVKYSDEDLPKLVKMTMKTLNIDKDSVNEKTPEAKIVKQILGSLSGLATGVAEFRNKHGNGHGKEANYKQLELRHANLAIGSSITIVNYLWDTYIWKRENGNVK